MSGPVPAPRRVLLIQLRRLGDVVLSTALLGDLRRAFPVAELDFLVGEAAAPLLLHNSLIARRIVYDTSRPVRVAREARARRYDWVIDVQSNPRTAMLTRASGAGVRAGWRVGFWGWVYTHTLPRAGGPSVYVARERQRFLEMLGVPVETPRPTIVLTDEERARGLADLDAAGARTPRAALVLTAASVGRAWPAERFAAVADGLAAAGVAPIVFRAPGDDAAMAAFLAHSRAAVVVPSTELRRFLAMLAGCDLLISADTGPSHMATALGVPRVTIYGPHDPKMWSPGLPTTVALRGDRSACEACRERRSDVPHTCTLSVTPVEVLDASLRLLAGRGGGASRERL